MQNIPRHLLINNFPLYALTPKERSVCRICGHKDREENFFYDEENHPKYRQCPYCEGISGCDDATPQDIYRYRYNFINQSAQDKVLQLQQVPQFFLQPHSPSIPTPKERNICRICGYEA